MEQNNICINCIYMMAQYSTGEFDCIFYGRVKNIIECYTFKKKVKNKQLIQNISGKNFTYDYDSAIV